MASLVIVTGLIDLAEWGERVRAQGLLRTPPVVLLTRWHLLVGDDELSFFDVAHNSGEDVPGARYTFVGISESAICYLDARHEDDMWQYDPYASQLSHEDISSRALVAWRRPLSAVTEIALGGSPGAWMANEAAPRAQTPVIVLRVETATSNCPSRQSTNNPGQTYFLSSNSCVRPGSGSSDVKRQLTANVLWYLGGEHSW